MLPMIISPMRRCSSVISENRICSSSVSCSEVPATSESNINCRRSSASGPCRIGRLVCAKWSRHSWSIAPAFSNSA